MKKLKKSARILRKKGMEACGVVTKFSTRNPEFELEIKDLLKENFHIITMGHRMSGKLNFPRRVYTSYLNSAVYSTFKDFARNLKGPWKGRV